MSATFVLVSISLNTEELAGENPLQGSGVPHMPCPSRRSSPTEQVLHGHWSYSEGPLYLRWLGGLAPCLDGHFLSSRSRPLGPPLTLAGRAAKTMHDDV